MRINISLKELYVFAAWIFYALSFNILWGSSYKLSHDVEPLLSKIMYITIFALLIYLVDFKYKLKDIFIIVAFSGIAFVVNNKELMIIILFALCGRNINPSRFLKVDIGVKIISVLLIFIACILGIIQNVHGYFYGTFKQSLGFQHPNTTAMYMYSLFAEILCLRYKKMKDYEYLIFMIGWVIVNQITHSRTTGYIFLLLIAVSFASRYFKKTFHSKPVALSFTVIMPFLTVLSIILTKMYAERYDIALKINSILSGRLNLQNKYMTKYPVTLFGQEFDKNFTRLFFLDSAYIRCLLQYGVIYLLLLTFLYMIFMNKICKRSDYFEYSFLAFFGMVLGFTETSFLRIAVNISLVLLLNSKLLKIDYLELIKLKIIPLKNKFKIRV